MKGSQDTEVELKLTLYMAIGVIIAGGSLLESVISAAERSSLISTLVNTISLGIGVCIFLSSRSLRHKLLNNTLWARERAFLGCLVVFTPIPKGLNTKYHKCLVQISKGKEKRTFLMRGEVWEALRNKISFVISLLVTSLGSLIIVLSGVDLYILESYADIFCARPEMHEQLVIFSYLIIGDSILIVLGAIAVVAGVWLLCGLNSRQPRSVKVR